MRTQAVTLLLALGGCAESASATVDYDHLASMLGTSIATPDAGGETGALMDAAILARGGLPVGFLDEDSVITGMHDGIQYTYVVSCRDLAGASMTCSPATGTAVALVEWSSPTQKRAGMWTLAHLQGATASVTGRSGLTHTSDAMDVYENRDEAFLLDLGTYEPRHGQIALQLDIDDAMIDGAIGFNGSRRAVLSLPGHVFNIDLDTGEIVPGQILR
jgi:hypothetical protein